MSNEHKDFIIAYIKTLLGVIALSGVIGLMFYTVHIENKRMCEQSRIESEYSWFLNQSRKILIMTDYINEIGFGDERYSALRDHLDVTVLEYNTRAVIFTSRSKWNCVAPYQYSTVELLYRGVVRDKDKRGN